MSVAAKMLGISFRQAQRMVYAGRMPSLVSDTGRRFVPLSWLERQVGESSQEGCRCAIYARESSSENKAALASQMEGLRRYAQAKGWSVVQVVQEYGSGVNDQRKRLHRLLRSRDFDVLLVEHKDRLTRFGFAWFGALCPFRIEVVNQAENDTHDLMEDLVAILTSFSARLYGQRRGRKKTQAAIQALEKS
ncbi:MAG: IS607 family transposase [Chloroflexota bacterium]